MLRLKGEFWSINSPEDGNARISKAKYVNKKRKLNSVRVKHISHRITIKRIPVLKFERIFWIFQTMKKYISETSRGILRLQRGFLDIKKLYVYCDTTNERTNEHFED